MFSRLLKYDIKAVLKIAIIISLSAIGASFLGGMALRTYYELPNIDDMRFFRSLSMIVFIISLFAVFATGVVISVFVYVRFYRNLYTDEGYLTFTLPAPRKTIHLAKTANAVIFTLYEMILFIVCAIIYVTLAPSRAGTSLPPEDIWPFSPFFTVGLCLISLLLFFASIVFSVCTVQLCITIGAVLAKRAKLIVGIVSYYAISMLLQFATQTLMLIFALTLGEATSDFVNSLSTAQIEIFILLFIALITLIIGALGAVAFGITQRIMDKRLNLA